MPPGSRVPLPGRSKAWPTTWRTVRFCSCWTTVSTCSTAPLTSSTGCWTRRGAVHILATSREPLGVAGEQVWPLGPLHAEGPALFVERARAADPRVRWDPADPAVIELCDRLDDVPLALELAAGQLRRFDLDDCSDASTTDSHCCGALSTGERSVTPRWRRDRLELPAPRAGRAVSPPTPQRLPVIVRRSCGGEFCTSTAEQHAVRGVRSTRRQEPRRASARHRALPAPRDDPRLCEGPFGGVRRSDCSVRAAPPPRARSDRIVVALRPVDVSASRRRLLH